MQNQDENQQVTAYKHRMQVDLSIKEGDYKKNEQRKAQLDMQIRQNQRKMDLLKMEMEKSKAEMEKSLFFQANLAKEIKKLKKDIAGM